MSASSSSSVTTGGGATTTTPSTTAATHEKLRQIFETFLEDKKVTELENPLLLNMFFREMAEETNEFLKPRGYGLLPSAKTLDLSKFKNNNNSNDDDDVDDKSVVNNENIINGNQKTNFSRSTVMNFVQQFERKLQNQSKILIQQFLLIVIKNLKSTLSSNDFKTIIDESNKETGEKLCQTNFPNMFATLPKLPTTTTEPAVLSPPSSTSSTSSTSTLGTKTIEPNSSNAVVVKQVDNEKLTLKIQSGTVYYKKLYIMRNQQGTYTIGNEKNLIDDMSQNTIIIQNDKEIKEIPIKPFELKVDIPIDFSSYLRFTWVSCIQPTPTSLVLWGKQNFLFALQIKNF